MSTNSIDRIYRPVEPSDLPKIQAGILKAFWYVGSDYRPAKLLSIKYGVDRRIAYLVEHPFGDGIEFEHNIVVDVTPEKRYAIWSHTKQRFVSGLAHRTRAEAEIEISEMMKMYAMTDDYKKRFYVVEWEIKKDD